ncbi:serine protease 53 [Drosophila busckii]|nr:serine protease 53 [Drosophila busckii]
MLKFVIVLSFIACAFGAAIPEGLLPQVDGRIVGGVATSISSFPWQISLQRNGGHSCGGSVYNSRIIVTAAHCLQSVSAASLQIRAGSSYWSSGGVVSKVAAFRNHEGYNPNTMINDIAIIKLSTPLSFSSTIKAIGLASYAPGNGAAASVSGWGTQSSGSSSIPSQLQYVNLKIVDRSQCASSSYSYGSAIKSTMICAAAAGKDSCQGDSGGPLVSGGQLVGVVSWGYGCADARYPGVYANVADLRSWVVNNSNAIRKCEETITIKDNEIFNQITFTCNMFKFVILLSVIACAFGAAIPEGLLPQLDGRIVGGVATSISSFPWQISLQRNGGHSCGGSIYNSRVIVTAAHCLQGVSASALRIRAGSSYWNSGGSVVSVASFKNHEGYNAKTMVNDIAVIRLSSALSFNGNIKAIGLASSTPNNGAAAVVSGWGTLKSGGSVPAQLQKVDLKIVGRTQCASSTYSYGSEIKATMICAAASGKDSCQGDSGGPLVSGGQLVGVVSWGRGCAAPKYPGVYANVAELRGWVSNNA